MGTEMPILETERLIIRPFIVEDARTIGRIRYTTDFSGHPQDFEPTAETYEADLGYVQRSIACGEYMAELYQPPYGDRAVVLKHEGRLIGSAGLVALLMPFEQIPYFNGGSAGLSVQRSTPEVGLYYAFDPDYWRQGYATETARALVEYCFTHMNLKRVVATTAYENAGSMGVMRKLGMTIERNPLPEPQYMQVVGILEYGG